MSRRYDIQGKPCTGWHVRDRVTGTRASKMFVDCFAAMAEADRLNDEHDEEERGLERLRENEGR